MGRSVERLLVLLRSAFGYLSNRCRSAVSMSRGSSPSGQEVERRDQIPVRLVLEPWPAAAS